MKQSLHLIRRAAVRPTIASARALTTRSPMWSIAAVPALRASENLAGRSITPVRSFSGTFASRDKNASGVPEDAGKSESGAANAGEETPYGVFVRNLVFDANEQHLRGAFEKYGEVSKAAIARDARGLSKGYGFIWFTAQEAVEKAIGEANGSFWHGRRLQVQRRTLAENFGTRRVEPTLTLYIGNIPYETTDEELNALFNGLENVTDVRVAVDRTTGWPRGFAHADFTSVEACVKARDQLQGHSIGGRELRFDFAPQSGKTRSRSPQTSELPPESNPKEV